MSTDIDNTPHLIEGTEQDDTLIGEAGNDLIIGLGGSNRLEGRDGDDTLHAGARGDWRAGGYVFGGAGDDELIGGHYLEGGEGNDTLRSAVGHTFDGGAGSDEIITAYAGSWKSVQFRRGSGHDVLRNGAPELARTEADRITIIFDVSVPPEDVVYTRVPTTTGTGTATLLSLRGSEDSLLIEGFDDWEAYFAFGAIRKTPAELAPVPDADVLIGSSKADTLKGGAGNDTLRGGVGADLLEGGEGADTYRYTVGDGHDIILADGQDEIFFGPEFRSGHVHYKLEGDTVTVYNLTTEGTITLPEFGRWETMKLRFSDGTTSSVSAKSHSSWMNQAFNGTAGDDTISAMFGADTLQGWDGNDVLRGGQYADLLVGGKGDDTMVGGAGHDTCQSAGDGHDVIDADAADRIVLASGLSLTRMTVTHAGPDAPDDVMLRFANASGQILVRHASTIPGLMVQDADGRVMAWYDVLAKADTTISQTLTGTDGADKLIGNDGTDHLIGGAGDDTLHGGYENLWQVSLPDTLEGGGGNDLLSGGGWLHGGDGNDTLRAAGQVVIDGGAGNDEIIVANNTSATLKFGRGSGQDVVRNEVRFGSGGVLIEMASGLTPDDVMLTHMANGQGGLDAMLSLRGSNDTLHLTTGNWAVSFGGGTVVMDAWSLEKHHGGRLLIGTDGDDMLSGDTGSDTLRGQAGNDTLEGRGGEDTYLFESGDGHDTIRADWFDKIAFEGSLDRGNLVVRSEGHNLTFTHARDADFGSVTLLNATSTPNVALVFNVEDALSIQDLLASSLVNQHLAGSGGNDILRGGLGQDTIEGLDGDDDIQAGLKDDVLVGGAGNDRLQGDDGADTYLQAGQGIDTIHADGLDTIVLVAGLNRAQMRVQRSTSFPDELILSFSGSGARVHLPQSHNLDGITLRFADGQSMAWRDVLALEGQVEEPPQPVNQTLTGTAGRDTLAGGDGHDTLSGLAGNDLLAGSLGNDAIDGGAGNDTLRGGLGNDTLIGTKGNDTYQFTRGDGRDTIIDSDATWFNSDLLQLSGTAINQLWFTRSGSNLDIAILGTQDKVTVQGWYSSTNNRLEKITAMDSGKSLTAAKVNSLVTAMAGFSIDPSTTTQLPADTPASITKLIASSWA